MVELNGIEIKVLGICGGSCSGKTTFSNLVRNEMGEACSIIGQDNYYYGLKSLHKEKSGQINFDHPHSIDFPLLVKHILSIKERESVEVPIYDFATHRRTQDVTLVKPNSLIVVDGILILSHPELREVLDASIFIECDEDLRFSRRLKRDVKERGRTREEVIDRFISQVKPMHDQYIEPSKNHANLIVKQMDYLIDAPKRVFEILDFLEVSR